MTDRVKQGGIYGSDDQGCSKAGRRFAGYSVQTGEFGAEMKVSLVNDGPFTILLDEHLLKS